MGRHGQLGNAPMRSGHLHATQACERCLKVDYLGTYNVAPLVSRIIIMTGCSNAGHIIGR
jgi:hypothetical protein